MARSDHPSAEALLAAIVSSSDDAIISKTLDGRMTSWNASAERLFGYSAEEAIGQSILLIIPTERRDEEARIIERIARGERVEHFETVRVAKDGRRVELSLTISPVRDRAGRVIGASKVARDISERRSIEGEARRAQDLLQLIVDNVPALISYVDRDYVYRLNNRAYETWFEQPVLDMTGRRVPDVLGPAAWKKLRPFVDAALAGQRVSYEDCIPYARGGARWIDAAYVPHLAEDGSVQGFAVLVHDVDSRRRSEEAQRLFVAVHDATRGLEDPVEVVRQIAAAVARHFAVIRCAYGELDAEERVLLLTPGYAEGVPSVAGAHPLERFGAALVEELMGGRTAAVRDVRDDTRTSDPAALDTWAFMEIRSLLCAPIVKAGRLVAVLAIGDREPRDWTPTDAWLLEQLAERTFFAVESARAATSLRESRDELRRLNSELSEADHRKDDFLALLAHELRNPLAPIRNAAEVLRLGGSAYPAVQRASGIIERQVRHLSRLVDDLLDISRIRSGRIELRREDVELASIVSAAIEAAQPLIEAKRHRVTVSMAPEPIHLSADATRLEQILLNLLTNAARYSPAGSRIDIVAGREGGNAVVRVRDDGTGIPSEMLGRIFEPFTQLDRPIERSGGGLGIGLALVRQLVALHGGRIEAHSEGSGQGSEFIVRLPALAEPALSSAPCSAEPTEATPRLRILVVDDDTDSADSLAALLEILGHEVRIEYDGLRAVAAADTFRPDVALLDIGLPHLNGYEVAREITKRHPEGAITLIAHTGGGQEADGRRSQEAGFHHHVVKPVTLDKLRELLLAVGRRVTPKS